MSPEEFYRLSGCTPPDRGCCPPPPPPGPTGPCCVPGPTPTETAMSARNPGGQTLAVVPEGTAVPLSSEQILRGFTANPGSTSFTVPETGAYLIFYHVQVQESAGPLTARVAGGGAVLPGSSSGRMGAGFYGACFVADLTAGDRLEVQLAGDTEIVLLPDGSGAGLSAVRLS